MARTLTAAGVTEILIDPALPSPLLPPREGRRRAAVLTQPTVSGLAHEIGVSLRSDGLDVEVIGLPDRDEAKTLAVAESVYEALADFGLGRQDTVVGVGGGAVTDMAGFVAGTWLRGVEVVHIPTTLLAAVDASIGGKTAVNLAGKNLVGVIWHPTRVAVDTTLLQKLPRPLLREGMAEAFKAGLIGDGGLADLLGERGLDAPLDEVVARAAAVKAGIVTRDDRELGERAFLNLGHTIGHAIEYAGGLSHGDSVAVGLVAAAAVSGERCGFGDVDMIVGALGRLELPTRTEGVDRARVVELLGRDKKRDAQGLRMVLLRAVGDPVLEHVGRADVDAALTSIGL